jgi:3-oxoacyl-[acyl-carrier protein] reductase
VRLEGRVALVTGGSRGLGPAICEELAAEGAIAIVGYRRRDREALAVVEKIRAANGRAEAVALDVRDPASVDAAVSSVLGAHSKIDVLVCSAGIHHDGFLATMSFEAWNDVVRTNLDGTMASARAVLRSMMARRAGSIVAIASVAGMRASPGQTNYSASKGGVLAFTSSLAAEVARHGIRVNAIVPGMFTAGMAAKMPPDAAKRIAERIPMARPGDPRELARAVVFLASDDASYVTGQALVVDGGLSA